MNEQDATARDPVAPPPRTPDGPRMTAARRKAKVKDIKAAIAVRRSLRGELDAWLHSLAPDEYGQTADVKEQRRQLNAELRLLYEQLRDLEAGG